jgi:hypothetical protein
MRLDQSAEGMATSSQPTTLEGKTIMTLPAVASPDISELHWRKIDMGLKSIAGIPRNAWSSLGRLNGPSPNLAPYMANVTSDEMYSQFSLLETAVI